MATHLSQILNKFAGQLIGQDDVQILLDNLSKTAPNLVESVVPKLVPLHNLTGILRELLSERVPISDLRSILESLASISSRNLSIVDTAEALGLHLQASDTTNFTSKSATSGNYFRSRVGTNANQDV